MLNSCNDCFCHASSYSHIRAPVSAGQTPLPWVARHGLSAADYQKAFDQFGKDFELTSVSAYLDKGQLRYAALWRQPAKRSLGRRATVCRRRISKGDRGSREGRS